MHIVLIVVVSVSDKTLCQVFLKFSIEILYKTLSTEHDVHENHLSYCHTFLEGIN